MTAARAPPATTDQSGNSQIDVVVAGNKLFIDRALLIGLWRRPPIAVCCVAPYRGRSARDLGGCLDCAAQAPGSGSPYEGSHNPVVISGLAVGPSVSPGPPVLLARCVARRCRAWNPAKSTTA
jgi:hypothetical protein